MIKNKYYKYLRDILGWELYMTYLCGCHFKSKHNIRNVLMGIRYVKISVLRIVPMNVTALYLFLTSKYKMRDGKK